MQCDDTTTTSTTVGVVTEAAVTTDSANIVHTMQMAGTRSYTQQIEGVLLPAILTDDIITNIKMYLNASFCPGGCSSDQLFASVVDGTVILKRSNKCYYQVQGQMALTGVSWCDFMIYTFKNVTIERIQFDAEFCESMQTHFHKVILSTVSQQH